MRTGCPIPRRARGERGAIAVVSIILLTVFVGFSVWYLGEPIRWNHLAGFVLIIAASFLIFADI